jgi:pectate lyase
MHALMFCFACCILVDSGTGLAARQVAFPGAEGFGKWTTGGTRLPPELTRPIPIRVLRVTSLADSGLGTLREAVAASGPRVVIFDVAGNIKLKTPLRIESGNITIAGQTAPAPGICVSGHPFGVNADNVVIRFMRFRLGDENAVEADAFGITPGRRNVIVDHCSMSWGVDETFSVYGVSDVTVQWCYITESLYESVHDKGRHGYGSIWGGNGVSFHHNLFAHHTSRSPRFNGGRYNPAVRELVDFRNNVVYNWGFNSSYGGESGAMINMVNNYYKYGPATQTSKRFRIVEPSADRDMSGTVFTDANGQPYHTGRWFVSGNYVYGNTPISANNWAGGVQGDFAQDPNIRAEGAFVVEPVPTQAAADAFESVLTFGGVRLPGRDALDLRIANEVRHGDALFGGVYGNFTGIIDTPSDVGGYPEYSSDFEPLPDRDDDGIPDVWEVANGMDPDDPEDAHLIQEDGYTNFEHYLNALAAPALPNEEGDDLMLSFVAVESGLQISWPSRFAGFLLERRDLSDTAVWEPVLQSLQSTSVELISHSDGEHLYRLRRQ